MVPIEWRKSIKPTAVPLPFLEEATEEVADPAEDALAMEKEEEESIGAPACSQVAVALPAAVAAASGAEAEVEAAIPAVPSVTEEPSTQPSTQAAGALMASSEGSNDGSADEKDEITLMRAGSQEGEEGNAAGASALNAGEDGDTQIRWGCPLCDIAEMTSDIQLQEHLASKSHSKRLAQSSSVLEDGATQTRWGCPLCDIAEMTSDIQLQEHLASESHSKRLAQSSSVEDGAAQQTRWGCPLCNTAEMTSESQLQEHLARAHLASKSHSKKLAQNISACEGGGAQQTRWGCPLCDIAEMTSESQLEQHLGSNGHSKKLAQSSSVVEDDTAKQAHWGCPLCDTAEMTSESQLQEHLGSKGHAKKLAQSNNASEDFDSFYPLAPVTPINNTLLPRENWGCPLCGIVDMTSESQLEQHLGSKGHAKKLAQNNSAGEVGGAQERWGCPLCGIVEMTTKSQLQEHLGSKGHAKKLFLNSAQVQQPTVGAKRPAPEPPLLPQKKQAAGMISAVAQAASTAKSWAIDQEVQVRNQPTEAWRRATVAGFEPGSGKPLAKRDGQSEAFTWNEMVALDSDGSSYRLRGEDGNPLLCLPMPQQERWGCTLCGIAKMTTESQLQEHLGSKGHAKKLAFLQTSSGAKRVAPNKSHAVMTPAAEAALASLAAKAASPVEMANPDDWFCSKCNNVNWARRTQCNLCGESKYLPGGGGGGGDGDWPPPFYAQGQQPRTYAPPPGMGLHPPPHRQHQQEEPPPEISNHSPSHQQQPPHQRQKLHVQPPPPYQPPALANAPPGMLPPPGILSPPPGFAPAQKQQQQQQLLLPISQRAPPAEGWPPVSGIYYSSTGAPPSAGPVSGGAYKKNGGYGTSAASGPSPSSFAPAPMASAAFLAPAAPTSAVAPMLADGWCAQTDPSDASRFYWHPTTGATTWDMPLANQQPAQVVAPAPALTMPPLPHGHPSILPAYMYGGASGMYEQQWTAPPLPRPPAYGQPHNAFPAGAWPGPRPRY